MLIPDDWNVKSFARSVRSRLRKQKRDPVSGTGTTAKPQVNIVPSNVEEHGSVQPTSIGPTSEQPSVQLPGHPTQVAQFFAGAHHLLLNNPTMIDQLTQVFESSRTVLQLLENRRIPGAEVDSSARHPPPKCHPETRKALRRKITTWLTDDQRDWRMIWLTGPAGTGKSAVAQTIAEHCQETGQLGAAFFFSRPNKRDNALRVLPTLAHQLAVRLPDYKHLVTQRLVDDSTILERNLSTQFKKLIVEPFTILNARQCLSSEQPLLIILDGLDECNGQQEQCEFIELISEHVRLMDTFPLLWMICSRPEWHLKRLLLRADFEIGCRREALSIDDTEAQEDVYRFLKDGFNDIHQRYWDILDIGAGESWPPEDQLRQLATAASGLFIFASTMLKFIMDEDIGDPNFRLKMCLRVAGGLGAPGATNPLHMLDLLYRQILSDIPADTLPTTMRILGLCILFPDRKRLYAQEISNYLCLDKSAFYNSLRRLHSVLDIPPPDKASYQDLRFYHASFGDFIRDPSRSGQFVLNEAKVRSDIARLSIRWYNRATEAFCELEDKRMCRAVSPKLEWSTGPEKDGVMLEDFHDFLDERWWCLEDDGDVSTVIDELSRLYFCHLASIDTGNFQVFLNWLYSLGHRNRGLIRLAAECETDNALLQKYGGPMKPATFPISLQFVTFYWVSLHVDCRASPRQHEEMFFLGLGTRACLFGYTPGLV